MIEMHWVIFVLALLVCGAIGWGVRGDYDRRRRRQTERRLSTNSANTAESTNAHMMVLAMDADGREKRNGTTDKT